MTSNKRISSCRGFTIIELLVTLSMTSVLVLSSATFLASADKSNRVQTAISGLNVSGRFGLEQVTRDLRMSGYRDSNWSFGALGDSVSATNGESAEGGDTLTVLYEGSRDCNFALAPGGIVSNTYAVVDGSLECNGLPLTSGVQELQIYLGEDTDNDEVANRWLSPGTAGLDMTKVVSVRIHMMVVTDGNDISSGPQRYFYNNAHHEPEDDGQIRREYTTTVALRNPI